MQFINFIKNIFKNSKQTQKRSLTVVSLFDGIACGRVALERIGYKIEKYYAYEIDKYAIKIAQKNYPDIIQMGSVVGADFKQFAGKVDILIGGSPCQNLSIAGDGTGLQGEKSKLFFEYVRALKEIEPKYFLFENVASMRKKDKNTISSILGVQPILLDSADFSAQTRKRYYWTNITFETKNYKKSPLVLGDITEKEVEEKYYYNYPLVNIGMAKRVCATIDLKSHDINKRVFNPAFKCSTLTACRGGGILKRNYLIMAEQES